jgi:phage terminase large subunit-like protein
MTDQKWDEIARKYAEDIIKGRIPACELVQLSCRRHLNDLKSQSKRTFPYRFNPKKVEKVCKFISQLRHIKGKWAGTEIKLEPWQIFFLANVFGWERKSDGLRRFREAYLEVPRKNAKSTIAAGIGLYMLTADGEPGSEVYAGATTEKQAWEVFTPARLMSKRDAEFLEHFELTVAAKSIFSEATASKFEPIVGDPGDGASPHCSITDEYHEHATDNQYDTMATGMGAREQPLRLITTTAGVDISGPCYLKRDEVIKVLKGVIEDPEIFGLIYTLDDEDDWTDIKNWKKANPNYGISVNENYIQGRHRTARNNPAKRNIIRCKHLNQWMNAAVLWMDILKWKRCADTTISIDDFVGKKCVMSLDMATKIDLVAKAYIFEEPGKRYLFLKYYAPEEAVINNPKYQQWVAQGWIKQTIGDVIDFNEIMDDLRDDSKRFDVQHIAYDPWQCTHLATEMMAEGAPMMEYRNTVGTMSEPMKQLQAEAYARKLVYNGDPVLDWMMSNVTAQVDRKENIFPRKEIDANKIDGVVAAIMAMGVSILHPEQYLTGYENGIEFI